MSNPILIELTRAALVESFHRGAVAIAAADGSTVAALGDVDRAIYPRSAIKAFQALPLVESGAAEAFGLDDAELAVACASHSGEPRHLKAVRSLLAKAGGEEAMLACGAHWPRSQETMHALIAAQERPRAIHNNCSGKHAGMIALALHLGADPAGYERPDHAVQRQIRETVEALTGAELRDDRCAVDGCSVPTWGLGLRAVAGGFARFATGEGLSPARAEACRRIMQACFAAPAMVAGQARLCTDVMRRLPGRAFVKIGAEGVYCAAFPERGLGLALKIDDGGRRAAEAALAHLITAILPDAGETMAEIWDNRRTNWRGREVGTTRPGEALAELKI